MAGRSLRRSPGFAATVIVTLVLGLGATTAAFAVVNAALLKPLPYPEAERIFVLALPDGGSQSGREFLYVRERTSVFERIAAQRRGSGWNFSTGSFSEYVTALRVSAGYFDVLGVPPFHGREFSTTEEQGNGPNAVIISEALWRRAFNSAPDTVGQVVDLGGVTHTVIGIMPSGFATIPAADVWTPLRTNLGDAGYNYVVVGRLSTDASADQAAAELDVVRPELLETFPNLNAQRVGFLLWMPYEEYVGVVWRFPLVALLGAVGLLLLIACTNVAGLQLARATDRRKEFATLAALGAGRAALVRHALTESMVLASLGAIGGLGVAVSVLRLIPAFVPPEMLDALLAGQSLALDWRVGVMLGATAVAAGLFFGLFAAYETATADVQAALGETVHTTPGQRVAWLRRSFSVVQIALTVVLLVAAGLLSRTILNITATDLGFDASGVIIGKMSLQGAPAEDPTRLSTFFDRALAQLRTVPGVLEVAASNGIPVERTSNLPLEPPAGALLEEPRSVDWQYVTADYFDVFRMSLLTGRLFDNRDRAGAAPVAIVNDAFAHTYFGDRNILGRHLQLTPAFSQDPPREIIGVVSNVSMRSNSGFVRGVSARSMSGAPPVIYVPAAQVSERVNQLVHQINPMNWALRVNRGEPALEGNLAAAMTTVDPTLPFIRFEAMDTIINTDLALHRALTVFAAVLAAIATVLACVSLYGLVAYTVSRCTREVGIRIALGATTGQVLRNIMKEGLLLTAGGVVLGLLAATLVTQVVASFLFGVAPLDPLTFAAVVAFVAVIALIATAVPAARAAGTKPATALRAE